MKILLTGATGFMGGNLLRFLAQDSTNELFYLSRGGKIAPAAKGLERVTCLTGDVTNYQSLLEASKDMDIIYHAAAMVSSLEKNRKDMELINVDGTKNILQAALTQEVKKFVHISTVDTIGLESDAYPANENTTYNFDVFHNPYCDTKTAAEACVLEAVKNGLDVVIVNPTFMIGAWDVKGSSSRMVHEIMKGNIRFVSKGGNCFVDVLDVCKGTKLAAEKGIAGERYILGGHNISYVEFFKIIAKVCGVSNKFHRVPNCLVKAVAFCIEKVSLFLKSKPLLSYNDAVFSTLPHYFSSDKAIKQLGYTISPIQPAIERARDWFKDNS